MPNFMRIDIFYEPITKKQFWSFTVYGVHQSHFQEHLYKKISTDTLWYVLITAKG